MLGIASHDEVALINRLCLEFPEINNELELIEKSLIHYASQTSKPLNPVLKNEIVSQLEFSAKENNATKVISIAKSERRLKLYKYGMAACLFLLITSLAYNLLLNEKLKNLVVELQKSEDEQNYAVKEININKLALASIRQQLQIVAKPKVITVVLNGMNSLAKNSAKIHWNTVTDELYFNASQLPKSPDSKQYQLWAIVAGRPVDAGIINWSDSGGIFQKMNLIKGAQAFAVTIEKVGGSVTPTLETMCLLGNV